MWSRCHDDCYDDDNEGRGHDRDSAHGGRPPRNPLTLGTKSLADVSDGVLSMLVRPTSIDGLSHQGLDTNPVGFGS